MSIPVIIPTLSVVDRAADQVEDKMRLFEDRVSSYTSQLNTSLDALTNILTGDDLPEAPQLDYNNNLPPNYQLITPPDFILPSVTPPTLDFGGCYLVVACVVGIFPLNLRSVDRLVISMI